MYGFRAAAGRAGRASSTASRYKRLISTSTSSMNNRVGGVFQRPLNLINWAAGNGGVTYGGLRGVLPKSAFFALVCQLHPFPGPPAVESSIVVEDVVGNRSPYRVFVLHLFQRVSNFLGGSETGTFQTGTLTFGDFSDIFLFVHSHIFGFGRLDDTTSQSFSGFLRCGCGAGVMR